MAASYIEPEKTQDFFDAAKAHFLKESGHRSPRKFFLPTMRQAEWLAKRTENHFDSEWELFLRMGTMGNLLQ